MASDIIYKITLSNGVVKTGPPQRLAGMKGAYPANGHVRIVKIERAMVNGWTDVSGRHIEGYKWPRSSKPDTQIAWALAAINEAYGPPEG